MIIYRLNNNLLPSRQWKSNIVLSFRSLGLVGEVINTSMGF